MLPIAIVDVTGYYDERNALLDCSINEIVEGCACRNPNIVRRHALIAGEAPQGAI
jgi:hypothetical protein